MKTINFEERLKEYAGEFARVVPFEVGDRLLKLDFTGKNTELTEEILLDTARFSEYIDRKLEGYKYGIGGYDEHRTIYSRSTIFSPTPTLPEGKGHQPHSASPVENSFTELQSSNIVEDDQARYGYHWADPFYYTMLQEYALKNRANPTQAEEILWEAIKSKKLEGLKFRRQFIIDKYIADIVCLDRRLVIEIDGSIHQLPENIESDTIRTESLNEKGFTVVRFSNEQVANHLELTLNKIRTELNSRPSIKENNDLSSPFGGQGAEPRRFHLGVDIWGPTHTPIYAPLEGSVHSFAFNDAYGDYGATLILQHDINGFLFHTLYGHLSLASIQEKQEGQTITKGEWIAAFGEPAENGQWPPHLHFQIIVDMQGMKGDYPGVCKFSEREKYLANCPDADLILQMMQYAK